jgi:hypothetical protein
MEVLATPNRNDMLSIDGLLLPLHVKIDKSVIATTCFKEDGSCLEGDELVDAIQKCRHSFLNIAMPTLVGQEVFRKAEDDTIPNGFCCFLAACKLCLRQAKGIRFDPWNNRYHYELASRFIVESNEYLKIPEVHARFIRSNDSTRLREFVDDLLKTFPLGAWPSRPTQTQLDGDRWGEFDYIQLCCEMGEVRFSRWDDVTDRSRIGVNSVFERNESFFKPSVNILNEFLQPFKSSTVWSSVADKDLIHPMLMYSGERVNVFVFCKSLILFLLAFCASAGRHFFVIDESEQIREAFKVAAKELSIKLARCVLRECAHLRAPSKQQHQLMFAATCGLDCARRHELITKGLAEMVSLVTNAEANHKPFKKKFNKYKNVCRDLALMSKEWTPGPISVTSWMQECNQSQLRSCLAQEAFRKYLKMVNTIFIRAYFCFNEKQGEPKPGVLALKRNVTLTRPFAFLYAADKPMMCEPDEAKALFIKDGDMLVLTRDVAFSPTEHLCLSMYSPKVICDNDEHAEAETMTEPQHYQNEEMQTEDDNIILLNKVKELNLLVNQVRRTKRGNEQMNPQLREAVDQLMSGLESIRAGRKRTRQIQYSDDEVSHE